MCKIYTDKDILAQLDECAAEFVFPMLDNGYVYLAGTKLCAYRDENRWVLIIEVIGFSYRGGGHSGVRNCLHIFGNCLEYKAGTRNENFLSFTDDSDDGRTFDEDESFYLELETPTFLLREAKVRLIHQRAEYQNAGIVLEEENRVNAFEFLRLLNVKYRKRTFATEQEIRGRIPADIPKILELDEWFHIDLAGDEKPSENETFQMLAKVLETGNLNEYKPTKSPNTHWSNWPESGTY